jgi:hypothetical protein
MPLGAIQLESMMFFLFGSLTSKCVDSLKKPVQKPSWVFVLLWLFFFCHGSTETLNFTKRSQPEGFRGFSCFSVLVANLHFATEAQNQQVVLKCNEIK